MGKGSNRRPSQISEDEMEDRWGSVFRRSKSRESENAEKNRYKRGQKHTSRH